MKPMKATCKNCKQQIEWLKGVGWTHLNDSKCTKPAPIKNTIV